MVEAMGSITTGIGRAVSVAPSLGKEAGVAASFASPKIGLSGGSFSSGLSANSLFSETKPFIASAGSVPEGSIAKSGSIFSDSGWSILGKADISAAPTTDVLSGLGFEPFGSSIASVPEMPVKMDVSDSAWFSLAERPKEVVEGSKTLTESLIADKKVQILTEGAVLEKKLTEKVVSLLVQEGLYSEVQAKKRVGEIALERRGLSEEAVGKPTVELRTEAEIRGEILTETSASRAKVNNQKTQVETDDDEKESKDELLKQKLFKQAPVVDEKAQTSRKKEIEGKISGLFNKARKFGLEKIKSGEITKDLDKDPRNRSLLLRQLWYPFLPDGSLEEASKTVESLGEITDISRMAEQKVEEWVEEVLDKNVPVKLAREKSKQVSAKDVKRVLKYIQPESVVG